jgi:hypothetical protein
VNVAALELVADEVYLAGIADNGDRDVVWRRLVKGDLERDR